MSAPPVLSFDPKATGPRVDLARLVASRMLIQANSGAGKSWALRFLLEQTHGKIPHLVLDPEGEFSTLREKFPYLLVGKDGDVPADPKTAKVLCRRLMEVGASAVIDIYELQPDARRRFVRLFLEELMHLPRKLWRPLLVVVDEAHNYCPERGAGEAESKDAVMALCTQGRKRGFTAVLATQRLAKLHKDAAAELLNKLIGRTSLDVDLKRAGDELGFTKDERFALRQLPPGMFYAYGPAISDEVIQVRTGRVQTQHPEPGAIGVVAPPAPAAVKKVLAQLADLAVEAEEEERTLQGLEKQVRELRGQLRQAQSGKPAPAAPAPPDPAVLEARVRREVDRAVAAERKRYGVEIAGLRRVIEKGVASVNAALRIFEAAPPPTEAPPLPESPAKSGSAAPPARRAAAPPRRDQEPRAAPSPPNPDGALSAPRQRILDVLAQMERLGVEQLAKPTLAALAKASPSSSGYANNLGYLRNQAGLIEYRGTEVALTEAGRSMARIGEEIADLEDFHAAVKRVVRAPQARILEVLIEVYPEAVDREELAEKVDASSSSSGYANNLGRLRSLGFIDYPQPGSIAATDLLFPEGLA